MPLNINKRLLPLKAHYFLYNGGTGAVWSYMVPYAKQLGFSAVVVGTIYSFLPISGVIFKPAFGAFADKFLIRKQVFFAFILVTIAAFYSVPWAPSIPSSNQVELHCSSKSVAMICNSRMSCLKESLASSSSGRNNLTCELNCFESEEFHNQLCSSIGERCADLEGNLTNVRTTEFRSAWNLSEVLHDQVTGCYFIPVTGVYLSDQSLHPLVCDKFTKLNCGVHCPHSILMESTSKSELDGSDLIRTYQFWILFFILVLCYIGMAVVVSVGDAICFDILGDRPSDYGYQRLWGSVGWGVVVFATGFAIDKVSAGHSNKDYTPAFYVMLVFLILDLIAAYKIEHRTSVQSVHLIRGVGKLLREAKVLVFILWVILFGIYQSLTWNFLFWYIEDLAQGHGCSTDGSVKTLEGFVTIIQCFLGELPCFFFSGWIIKKVGHVTMMSVVLALVGLRFVLYSFIANPWYILFLEPMTGFTFGMFFSCMTSYANMISLPGTEATMQGLAGGLFEGVGVAFGSFLAGLAFQGLQGWQVFRLFGAAAFISSLLHFIAQYMLAKRSVPVLDSEAAESSWVRVDGSSVRVPESIGCHLNDGGSSSPSDRVMT